MENNPPSDMVNQPSGPGLRNKLLRPRESFSNRQLSIFIAAFALIGAYFLIHSFAYNDPTALVLYHSDGQLVKSADDANIYLISGGQRHLVSLDDFRSGRYNYNQVIKATSGDEQYPVGSDLTIPPGVLIQSAATGAYYVTDTDSTGNVVRRPISPLAMILLGYNPTSAQQAYDMPAQGSAISAASAHPTGTEVTSGGQTYLVQNGELRPVSSDVLSTYNYKYQPAVKADGADMALPKGPAMPYADGTLVQGSNPNNTYVIDDQDGTTVKRLIRDPIVFNDLGYSQTQIHHVADSQLPAADGSPLPQNTSTPMDIEVILKKGYNGSQFAKSLNFGSTAIHHIFAQSVAIATPYVNLASLRSNPAVQGVISDDLYLQLTSDCNTPNSGPAVPCPVINSFASMPGSVDNGGSSTLAWNTSYADACTINGKDVATNGSESTGSLKSTTGYTLTCYSGNNQVTAAASVTVGAPSASPSALLTPAHGAKVDGALYSNSSSKARIILARNCDPDTNCGPSSSTSTGGGSSSSSTSASSGGGSSGGGSSSTSSSSSSTSSGGSAPAPSINLWEYNSGNTFTYNVSLANTCQIHTDNPAGGIVTIAPTLGANTIVTAGNGGGASLYCFDQGTPAPNNGIYASPSSSSSSGSGTAGAAAINSWTYNGGNSFTYNVSSSSSCTVHTDNPAGGSQFFTPSLNVNATVTAGNGGGGSLYCYNGATPAPQNGIYAGPSSSGGTGSSSNSCSGVTSGVEVFSGANYGGTCYAVAANTASLANTTIGNDHVSSLKVLGNYAVDLYQNVNYGGTFSELTENHPTLANFDVGNSATSSIQLSSNTISDPSTVCPAANTPGVYLYAQTNYGGSCDYFTGIDLRSEKWHVNDNGTRSAKIVGNYTATLYSGMKLTGNSLSVPANGLPSISGSFGTSSIYVSKIGGNAPVATTSPKLSGSTIAPSTLTVTTSRDSWNTGGLVITGFQYTWSRCPSVIPGPHCTGISGANTATYTTTSADIGYYIEAVVYATDSSGTGTAQSNLIGPIANKVAPPPSSADLAQQILANPKIGGKTGCTLTDLQDAAKGVNGTAGAPISLGILQLIAYYGQGHSEYISAIESCGNGHCVYNNVAHDVQECPTEPHYRGVAVDFSSPVTTGRDPAAQGIVAFTEANFSGARFGQEYDPTTHAACGPAIPLPSGFSQVPDVCTHLHVDSVVGYKGSATQSAQAPVVSANATSVAYGQSATLSWSGAGLDDCFSGNGSTDWSGSRASKGSFNTGELTQTTTFTLNCGDIFGHTVSRSVTVNVTPPTLSQRSPGLAAIGWTPQVSHNVVAVVGTGVNQVPGLDVRYSYGANNDVPDCAQGAGNYDASEDQHDTQVAKMIGLAGDGINTPAGVAPGTIIVGIRATDADSAMPTTTGIACGIRWAADHGIKIINVSSAALKSDFTGSGLEFNNCQAPNAEAELSAICYAAGKGATVVTAAGNYADSAQNYLPAAYSQAVTVTSANEFNGQPPNSPNASTAPKDSSAFIGNGFSGFCGQGTDDYGQTDMDYNGSDKANFYAAPVCVWLGEDIGANQGYSYGTSFAAAMASGVLARDGNTTGLAKGGAVLSPNGKNYGFELHI